MKREDLTIDLITARFIEMLEQESTAKVQIITAGYMIASRENEDASVRGVLKLAGYAASKFYGFWPGRSEFILDGYLYCVEKYIDAEVTFAREFSGKTPREFFALIAYHTVLSQRHVSQKTFREIAGKLAEGDYSKLLVHMESQVRRNMEVFVDKFPEYRNYIDISCGRAMMWAVGTFILNRTFDEGLKTVTDDELVDLIVDTYAGFITRPIS